MVKHSKNRNLPEGSEAPMAEEVNDATIIKNDHTDHFKISEKQLFKQRLLEMEYLVHVIVHNNTNLQTRFKRSELNKSFVNVLTVEKTAVPPADAHQYASTSAQKEKKLTKLPRPPVRPLS